MTAQHTPGPWHISKSGQYIRKNDGPNWPAWNIAEMNQATDAAHANARLIAAAPELLAACEASLRDLSDLERHWANEAESFDHPVEKDERRMALDNLAATRRVIAQIRAAIAKARGA